MELEKAILDEMSQQLANEMDQHILIGFMIELGWREVIVDPWQHGSLSTIQGWIKDNIANPHMNMGNRWVFENEKDATMFTLKWS
jgi:hypothetical protein